MSNRAARRAAAHKTMEAARQASASVQSPVAQPVPATLVSEAQLAANRANAQSSTGPKSEQGKLVSSHNALKTGLTGRTIVLPTDDVAAYQSFVALINRKFAPANDIEQHLTQTIADTEWRLLRIPTLESGLLRSRPSRTRRRLRPRTRTLNSAPLCSKLTSSAPIKRTSAISPCRNAVSAINSNRTLPNYAACKQNASHKKPQRSRARQQAPPPPNRKMASNFQLLPLPLSLARQ